MQKRQANANVYIYDVYSYVHEIQTQYIPLIYSQVSIQANTIVLTTHIRIPTGRASSQTPFPF